MSQNSFEGSRGSLFIVRARWCKRWLTYTWRCSYRILVRKPSILNVTCNDFLQTLQPTAPLSSTNSWIRFASSYHSLTPYSLIYSTCCVKEIKHARRPFPGRRYCSRSKLSGSNDRSEGCCSKFYTCYIYVSGQQPISTVHLRTR